MTELHDLLARNMKRERALLGLTQADLAEKAGISVGYVGELEIGRKFPSAENLEGIAQALKLRPFRLLDGPEDVTDAMPRRGIRDCRKAQKTAIREIDSFVREADPNKPKPPLEYFDLEGETHQGPLITGLEASPRFTYDVRPWRSSKKASRIGARPAVMSSPNGWGAARVRSVEHASRIGANPGKGREGGNFPLPIISIDPGEGTRVATGMAEFDRVLGGGLMRGSAVLLGGEPGIGKSTLLLQLCGKAQTKGRLLYVSGEESPAQIRMRAERLGALREGLEVFCSNDLGLVRSTLDALKPSVAVVDSIQTLRADEAGSIPAPPTRSSIARRSFRPGPRPMMPPSSSSRT